MPKTSLMTAALLLIAALPAIAQTEESRRHSAMQHLGGHWRHGHRDWSGSRGRAICIASAGNETLPRVGNGCVVDDALSRIQ